MIKVFVGYKVREGVDIQPILSAFQSHKSQYQGFIGTEILKSINNGFKIIEISTWNEDGAWIDWDKSTEKQDLLGQIKELLVDQPMVSVYKIVPMSK